MPEAQAPQVSSFISYFAQFFVQDWFASIPITVCAIITLGAAIDRLLYYSRNKRDIGSFIRAIQKNLESNNLDAAITAARQVGGLIGMMAEEGLRLVKNQPKHFSSSFDISYSLYVDDLEKRLPILATIGATAPFWGLFGTVVGVIDTLRLMGEQGGQSQAVVIGVAKALIATGFGLIVAIVAVTLNNWFNSRVKNFENEFQLIKLTLMDYLSTSGLASTSLAPNPNGVLAPAYATQPRQPNAPSQPIPPQPNTQFYPASGYPNQGGLGSSPPQSHYPAPPAPGSSYPPSDH